MSSPAVEALDVVNVPEYGVLLAADLCWCVGTGCLVQMVEGEQVYLFHKLSLAVQQLLDEMAMNTDKTSGYYLFCCGNIQWTRVAKFTHNNFFLYSPSDTSSTLVSGRSAVSAESCKSTHH